MDDWPTCTLYPGRWKTLGLLAMTGAMSAGGFLIIEDGVSRWFVTSLFGLGAAASVVQVLPRFTWLRVGPEGFAFRSPFRVTTYRWTDVVGFGVASVASTRRVVFDLVEGEDRPTHMRRLNKRVFGFECMLPCAYGTSPEELADLLNAYGAAHVYGGGA